jgi:hypothetical protein
MHTRFNDSRARVCQSLSFCYTDLFCCSSRRQSLFAPTATTTWTCSKLEAMSLDGCTTRTPDWDTRSFVESHLPAHVRAMARIPAAGRATYGHRACASILLCDVCVCLDGDDYHWHDDAAPSTLAPLGCSHLVPPNVSRISWPLWLKSLHRYFSFSISHNSLDCFVCARSCVLRPRSRPQCLQVHAPGPLGLQERQNRHTRDVRH